LRIDDEGVQRQRHADAEDRARQVEPALGGEVERAGGLEVGLGRGLLGLDLEPLDDVVDGPAFGVVPDDCGADDGRSRRHRAAGTDPDGADELGPGFDLRLGVAPYGRVAAGPDSAGLAQLPHAQDGGIRPPPELHEVVDEIGQLAGVAAVVDVAVDALRRPAGSLGQPPEAPPALPRVGGRLPELRHLALRRQHHAGERTGRVVDALEADEPPGRVGDRVLAVGPLAGVVEPHEKDGRLYPVQDVHQGAELKERQRAGVGQEVKLGVPDDLRRLPRPDHLDAERRPVAGVELDGIQAPDRAGGRGRGRGRGCAGGAGR
jgi:hypothetical protein